MIKIATWNVNSIKARLEVALKWVDRAEPDLLLLQEIKCQDEGFPALEFQSRGYQAAIHGQKSYNGVAVLSRLPFEVTQRGLPGDDSDDQARYLEVKLEDGLRLASLYLPNGNPVSSEKYGYKLGWMERLTARAAELLAAEEAFVLGGDYNVIPAAEDARNPQAWIEDALFRLETRRHFRRLVNLGLTEAWRAFNPETREFSFWDYQGGAFQNDDGIRIDHLLCSPRAADRLRGCSIDREPRGWPKASDHTPVLCELAAA